MQELAFNTAQCWWECNLLNIFLSIREHKRDSYHTTVHNSHTCATCMLSSHICILWRQNCTWVDGVVLWIWFESLLRLGGHPCLVWDQPSWQDGSVDRLMQSSVREVQDLCVQTWIWRFLQNVGCSRCSKYNVLSHFPEYKGVKRCDYGDIDYDQLCAQ